MVWLVLIGLAGNNGQILYAAAIHDGGTNVVMPFGHLRLIWIAAIALGEIPTPYTWAGGTMIFGSAGYIAYRQRTIHRKWGLKAPAAPDPVPPDAGDILGKH